MEFIIKNFLLWHYDSFFRHTLLIYVERQTTIKKKVIKTGQEQYIVMICIISTQSDALCLSCCGDMKYQTALLQQNSVQIIEICCFWLTLLVTHQIAQCKHTHTHTHTYICTNNLHVCVFSRASSGCGSKPSVWSVTILSVRGILMKKRG